METKAKRRTGQKPTPDLENLWVPIYLSRDLSEILREWIPELLPWRKKKRKRP